MKQFINPFVISLVLISALDFHVNGLPSSKTLSDSLSGASSSAGSKVLKDLKTEGSALWSSQPEYYNYKPSSYGYKDRLDGYNPLSADHKGAYYTSGGVFDWKKPSHGSVDYHPTYVHDYDNHYAYKPHGHAFSLDHSSFNGKDLFKSVFIPLAGVALFGLAAALVVNPALLHLGSLGVGLAGKRKRRDVTDNAQNLAYRSYLKQS